VLVLAVVAGCAVVGLIAGAMLGGGSDGGTDAGPSTSPSAEASQGEPPAGEEGEQTPTTEPSADAGADADAEARAQAEALSALLQDSSGSRDAVVRSVGNIRECRELDAAAADLRAAAGQRNDLVARLNGLALDRIPQGDALAQALTEAWQASAQADDHYAAWADEARGDRGRVCRGGQAQHTDSANQGDAASARATEAKQRAADLWNPVARTYGLPERDASQL
jgi:hypothetical protein